MKVKRVIEIEQAKKLEKTLKFFTDPYHTDIIHGEFSLTTSEGLIHNNSDKFVKAVVNLNKNLETIRKILE